MPPEVDLTVMLVGVSVLLELDKQMGDNSRVIEGEGAFVFTVFNKLRSEENPYDEKEIKGSKFVDMYEE